MQLRSCLIFFLSNAGSLGDDSLTRIRSIGKTLRGWKGHHLTTALDGHFHPSGTSFLPQDSLVVEYRAHNGRGSCDCLRGNECDGLEIEIAIDAPEPADRIVEDPEVRRAEVLLNIARIVVIGDVDDFHAAEELNAMVAELEIEGVLKLEVKTGECWKAASLIARADVVPIFVQLGIRETGVRIKNRNEL